MRIGIHPDRIGEESYSEKWTHFLKESGIEVVTLDLLRQDALSQAADCDGVMWRWAHNPQDKQSAKVILYTIEHYLDIPVYPNNYSSWHYDEKISQHYFFQAQKIPTPDTHVFWKEIDALDFIDDIDYPIILKLSGGAGSANVVKIRTKEEAKKFVSELFNTGVFPYTFNEFKNGVNFLSPHWIKEIASRVVNSLNYVIFSKIPPLDKDWWKPDFGYAYFQEFLPDNPFDTRVTIIGDSAFAFRRFNRPNDFRASGSGLIDYDPSAIDLRCVESAFKISERANFQSMAYDFLFKSGVPVVCEISYTFTDSAIFNCPGHWSRDMKWVEGQVWPEEVQVRNFIQYIEGRTVSKKITRN